MSRPCSIMSASATATLLERYVSTVVEACMRLRVAPFAISFGSILNATYFVVCLTMVVHPLCESRLQYRLLAFACVGLVFKMREEVRVATRLSPAAGPPDTATMGAAELTKFQTDRKKISKLVKDKTKSVPYLWDVLSRGSECPKPEAVERAERVVMHCLGWEAILGCSVGEDACEAMTVMAALLSQFLTVMACRVSGGKILTKWNVGGVGDDGATSPGASSADDGGGNLKWDAAFLNLGIAVYANGGILSRQMEGDGTVDKYWLRASSSDATQRVANGTDTVVERLVASVTGAGTSGSKSALRSLGTQLYAICDTLTPRNVSNPEGCPDERCILGVVPSGILKTLALCPDIACCVSPVSLVVLVFERMLSSLYFDVHNGKNSAIDAVKEDGNTNDEDNGKKKKKKKAKKREGAPTADELESLKAISQRFDPYVARLFGMTEGSSLSGGQHAEYDSVAEAEDIFNAVCAVCGDVASRGQEVGVPFSLFQDTSSDNGEDALKTVGALLRVASYDELSEWWRCVVGVMSAMDASQQYTRQAETRASKVKRSWCSTLGDSFPATENANVDSVSFDDDVVTKVAKSAAEADALEGDGTIRTREFGSVVGFGEDGSLVGAVSLSINSARLLGCLSVWGRAVVTYMIGWGTVRERQRIAMQPTKEATARSGAKDKTNFFEQVSPMWGGLSEDVGKRLSMNSLYDFWRREEGDYRPVDMKFADGMTGPDVIGALRAAVSAAELAPRTTMMQKVNDDSNSVATDGWLLEDEQVIDEDTNLTSCLTQAKGEGVNEAWLLAAFLMDAEFGLEDEASECLRRLRDRAFEQHMGDKKKAEELLQAQRDEELQFEDDGDVADGGNDDADGFDLMGHDDDAFQDDMIQFMDE